MSINVTEKWSGLKKKKKKAQSIGQCSRASKNPMATILSLLLSNPQNRRGFRGHAVHSTILQIQVLQAQLKVTQLNWKYINWYTRKHKSDKHITGENRDVL